MNPIFSINIITQIDPQKFYEDVKKLILELQSVGQDVEVQYGYNNIHSAFIIGRKEMT